MSAGDMFVPLGNEHAYQSKKFKDISARSLGKMLGGAVLVASVMMATRLKAQEATDENSQPDQAVDPLSTASLYNATSQDNSAFGLEQVLGSITDDEAVSFPIEVATLGALSLGTPASPEPATATSREGLPRDFVTPSPGVSDPSQTTADVPVEFASSFFGSVAAPASINIPGLQGPAGINGINGTDGIDGENGSDGSNGSDGADGQDGADGETILILDASLLENTGILETLAENGIETIAGPAGTVMITVTPDELDLLVSLIDDALPPQTDDTDAGIAVGTEQQDFITGDDGDNVIAAKGEDDILVGGNGADTLVGGEGNDTAVYIDSAEGVFIDLENELATGGEAEGDILLSIENLDGSNLDDQLLGDELANMLFGNDGDDTLLGRGGADTISGGAGADFIDGGESLADTADYADSDEGIFVSLLEDTASGGHATGDELDNIEFLDGSFHDDTLQGDGLNNRLGGRNGEDILLGEGGNDTLLGGNNGDIIDGGDGIDTSDYTASTEAVNVNLLTGEAHGGEATGDTLISIENLAGSAFDDVLTGDNGNNRITSRDGNDTLIGNGGNDTFIGGQGADHIDGGEGDRDTIDFRNADSGVGLDLDEGGYLGEAAGDTYENIEFVVGSNFDDIICGNDGVNRITGGLGNDQLFGHGGNDTIIGGLGDDILNGGEGNDVFLFDENSGNDTISDFSAGSGRTDRIWLQDHEFEDFSDLQDSISQTENGALIALENGSSILLSGVNANDLVADDFILA